VLLGIFALLLIALIALAALGDAVRSTLRTVQVETSRAREQADLGRVLLLSGDLTGAAAAFDDSAGSFTRARAALDDPAIDVVRRVQLADENVETVAALAEAGRLTARAGVVIAEGLADIAGGTSAFAPRDGQLPIDALVAMRAPLAKAEPMIGDAAARAARTPSGLLLPPVAEARASLLPQLEELAHSVAGGRALAEQLPDFLGASGGRRYFFGASTPAQSRGTGGAIGSYAILTVDDGRLSFSEFNPAQSLPEGSSEAVPAPSAAHAKLYEGAADAGLFSNANLTPDFPTAATVLEARYQRVSGERLDGSVVVDPFALRAMLVLAGHATVSGVGRVDAGNVVDFITQESYGSLGEGGRPTQVFGGIFSGVLQRFLDSSSQRNPVATMRVLSSVAGEGHLLLHAADPGVQSALEAAGIAGRLLNPRGDYVSVIVNNGTDNRTDLYTDRDISYEVDLAEAGAVHATATVKLRGDAEGRGERNLAVRAGGSIATGESLSITSLYAAEGAELNDHALDGAESDPAVGAEGGHPVWTDAVRLRQGEAAELAYRWRLADGWSGDAEQGSYRLTVQGQTSLLPTTLALAVNLPPGSEVISATPGLEVGDGRVTYDGPLREQMRFQVTFGNTAVARTWDRLPQLYPRM